MRLEAEWKAKLRRVIVRILPLSPSLRPLFRPVSGSASELQEGELSRHELSHAQAVFLRTSLYHSNVTWETNALRDCLYASALPRHLSSTWFSHKNEARSIDRRR